jgi:hypothetical protein
MPPMVASAAFERCWRSLVIGAAGAGNRVGWDSSGSRDPQAHGIDDGLLVSDVLNQGATAIARITLK